MSKLKIFYFLFPFLLKINTKILFIIFLIKKTYTYYLYKPKVDALLDGHSFIHITTDTNSELFNGFPEHNDEIAAKAKFK
jgi:hypothetical protein